MIQFNLHSGETALVDDEDWPRVRSHKWSILGPGYAGRTFRVNGKVQSQYLHHFILGKTIKIDHKDRNKLNNQKSNLRPATNRQNAVNTGPWKKPKISKFRGVFWHKKLGKWQVQLGHDRQYGGIYFDETEAAKAYDSLAVKRWGEFAQLNFQLRM